MDRTNVTDKGYTFNGQNFTNETRTDSQGNNYTVAVPSTISTATLSAPTTLPVTQPQYNTSGQQSLASQAGAYVNTATTAAEQTLQAEQDALKASQTDVGRLLTDAGNKGTDIASQYNQQDATGQSVNSLAAKLRQLSARSNALSIDNLAKSQREINNATGQNITQSAVTRNTADATRENLINQASIAMESAIVNADYQSAKSYADQMVDAKYDKLEADTKAALFNLENNKERFTAAEKKVAEATTARLLKEQKKYEEDKANEKDISKMIIEATPNAPTSVIANAKKLAESGASKLAVAQALGVYGGDVLKRTLMEEQIKTERAQRRQIEAKTSELGVSLPSGLKATAVVNQPVFQKLRAKEQTQAVALDNLIREINYYKAEVNAGGTSGGVNLFGADSARLSSRLNSLLFAAAQAEGTGALQAADKAVLEQSLPNPTTLGGAFTNLKQGGLDGMNEKLDVQIQKYTDNMGTLGLSPTYNEFSRATAGMLPPPPGEDISIGTDAQGNMQFSLPTSTKKY